MHWRVQQGDTSKFCLINCPQSQIAREQNHWNMTSEADRRWHFHYISAARGTTPEGGDLDRGAAVLSSPPTPPTHHPHPQLPSCHAINHFTTCKRQCKMERYISTHLLHNQSTNACTWDPNVDGWSTVGGWDRDQYLWEKKKNDITHFRWLMKVVLPSRWHAEEALRRYCVCWRFQNCHLGWTHGWRRPIRSQRNLGNAPQVQTRYLTPFVSLQ